MPQQTLFSWGAFMAEESVKPKGPEPLAPARRVPVRLDAQPSAGAREGVGRRGPLDHKATWEVVANRATTSHAGPCMRPSCIQRRMTPTRRLHQ